MDTFVTVLTSNNSSEASIIRAHLESEGIECILLNELASQVNPYNLTSLGGVQIQVKEGDLPITRELLKDAGYLNDEEYKPSELTLKLEKITAKIPIINKLVFGIRISILVAFIITGIVIVFYFLSLPSSSEIIIKHTWCLDKISYEGKNFTPNSLERNVVIIGMNNGCKETIQFWNYGRVNLPGINSRRIEGNWKIDGNKMQISNIDTFQFVYNGIYSIDLTENILTLKSDKTILYCSMENGFSSF